LADERTNRHANCYEGHGVHLPGAGERCTPPATLGAKGGRRRSV